MSGSLMIMIGVVSVLARQVASLKVVQYGERGATRGSIKKAFDRCSGRSALPVLYRRLDDSAPHPALYAIEQQPEGRPLHERSYFFSVSSSRAAQGRP